MGKSPHLNMMGKSSCIGKYSCSLIATFITVLTRAAEIQGEGRAGERLEPKLQPADPWDEMSYSLGKVLEGSKRLCGESSVVVIPIGPIKGKKRDIIQSAIKASKELDSMAKGVSSTVEG
ncbi:hypothetical protein ACH5RR_025792 [Cinchona calisaya]|uniref:Uncharacterized protein n=1 Tax=Cinchona calisaya TaxID=153742 RepID=A0ABD2Z407_9GENT